MNCPVEEELAALADNDLPAERAGEVLAHVGQCERCRTLLEALGRVDDMLTCHATKTPPPNVVLAARRALEPLLHPRPAEIMTLDQVGEFLQIEPRQLGEIVDELPAFELAGQIRIRRSALLEWIRQREEDFRRESVARCVSTWGGTRQGIAL